MPAKKRANGEGTISQHPDGRWWARITLPDGRRKAYYGKMRREVQLKLTAALRDQQQGLPIVGERQTVRQFFVHWLEDTASHRVRPSTFRRYEEFTRLRIVPALGKLPLTKLTPQHLSHLYSDLLATGLSPRTVEFIHRTVHVALKEATQWGLIARNPADAVKAPKPKRPPIHPLNQDQANAFLDAAQGDPLEALYVLAVMIGMRQGELLGLQWADIDWTGGRVQVRHTLQWRKGGEWSLDEPKTGHSRRSIRMPASALHGLRTHKAQQAAQRLAVGPTWQDHGLVFTNALGRPIDPCALAHRGFPRLLARAGLPKIRFHDLRHTYATLALLNGEKPKVVQETLGHASITLTMDTYSHLLPDMQEDAAARMERLLGRRTGT
jgi:integrase